MNSSPMRRASSWSLRVLWQAVRLPALATLLVLEPIVRVICSAIAVLGILMSLTFRFLLHVPHFPFGTMLAISIGFAVLLVPFYGLIRLFSTTSAAPSE